MAVAVPATADSSTTTTSAAPSTNSVATKLPASTTASTELPRIGAMADVGVPDGASVSVVYRPFRQLRASAGISHNMISLGERIGVTYTPFAWWARPTLSLEYGHYADGNANPLVRMFSGDETFNSASLERVGYSYANARLGAEFGRKWFTFYVHAGMSRIAGTVHNLSEETMSQTSGTTTVNFSRDPDVRVWTVSASLGFVVYLAK